MAVTICEPSLPAIPSGVAGRVRSHHYDNQWRYWTMTNTERKPRVSPLVPTRAIDRKLGWVHVGTPDDQVEALILEAIDAALAGPEGDRWTPAVRRQTVRYALWRHHRNLAGYMAVMGR